MNVEKINNFFSEIGLAQFKNLILDEECAEYDGCTFTLNNCVVKYRKTKVTPKKIGQFVTLWKRDSSKKTVPFHEKDNFDFYLMFSEYETRQGFFFFPKKVLVEKHILSSENGEGKRGFRVYPAWDLPISKQALKTQKWQNDYFIDLTKGNELSKNTEKFRQLFGE